MAAIRQDLTFFAAEDWPLSYTIIDSAGAVKDLTNAVAVWVLKRAAEDTAEVLRRSGTIGTPASAGQITVPFYPADTLALLGAYYYELQVTVGGIRKKVAYGSVTVRKTAIRDAALALIPATYWGMHIIDPNDIATVGYGNARATGESWIHLEGDGISSTINTGIPGTYDWRALDDQLTAATALGARLMYTTEKIPTFATKLAVAITDTVSPKTITIVVGAAGTAAFLTSIGMRLKIDNEYVTVASALTNLGGGNGTLSVTRGSDGTVAATHLINTKVTLAYYYAFPSAAALLDWAAANPGDPYGIPLNTGPANAAGLVAWASFCAALVQRYKGDIEAYELYNEPEQTWSGTTAEFVAFAEIFKDAIRLYDPAALVVTPACQTVSYLDTFWAAGGTRDVDVVSFHGYPLTVGPVAETLDARKVAPLKAILSTYDLSDKPIWDSEASWGPLSSLPGDDQQRAFLAIYYLLHWGLGVVRFYWYSWDDTLGDGTTVGFGALVDGNKGNALAAAITTTGQTAITLAAGANVASATNGKYIGIDGEAMKIISGGGTVNLVVTRAQLGTTAVTHLNGHNVSLLLAAAPAYWQVRNWMYGATMVIPAAIAADGTWSVVFSRAGGYQALATWNTTATVSFTPPGIYTKYRDLDGTVHTISGAVSVGALPLLFETS